MKRFVIGTVAGIVLLGGAFGFASTATAAPAGPATATATIKELEAGGYTVIVNRIGSARLDMCTVGAIRHGQTYMKTDSGVPGAGNDVITQILSMTAYVDLSC
jgi:hypothetical protein